MRSHHTRLGPDDMVVLSTNDLLNSAGRGPAHEGDDLVSRAAQALDDCVGRGSLRCERADEVGRSLLARHVTAHMGDDVAVLVAQRMPAPETLSLRLDVDTLDLGEVRSRISEWLDGLGAGLADHISLGHVVMELAANVVNHAYRRTVLADGWVAGHGDRPLRIDAALDDSGVVVASVSD